MKKRREDDEEVTEQKKLAQEAKDALNRKKKEQELIDKMNAAAMRIKMELLDANMTEEVLEKKVNDLVASRGKKGTDHKIIVRHLEVLAKISRVFGPNKEIPVLMHLVSSIFDSNKMIDDYLDLQTWRSCCRYLTRIIKILNDNKKLVLSVNPADEDVTLGIEVDSQKKSEEETTKAKTKSNNLVKVIGSLESFIIRLDADYTKSLQQINPHTQV